MKKRNVIRVVGLQTSKDGSIKFCFENERKNKFESIYFGYDQDPYNRNYVICSSSQSGCLLKCKFCATGLMGFRQNLSVKEILYQTNYIQKFIKKRGLPEPKYYILMGMGEPLLNYENVIKFYKEVKKDHSDKHLSLSTIGVKGGIRKLATEVDVNYKLYISIGSPFSNERNTIIPHNRIYNLDELIDDAQFYAERKKTRVTASYTLIKNINDSKKHAQQLCKLLNPEQFRIQLIPFNEIPELKYEKPDIETIHEFKKVLDEKGFYTWIQISKGRDIGGGCGQMAVDLGRMYKPKINKTISNSVNSETIRWRKK